MQLRFLGHATFLITVGEHVAIVDPFVEGNPRAPLPLKELLAMNVSHVLLTHAHGDHWGNTMDFATAGATVVGPSAVASYAKKHGAAKGESLNTGGGVDLPWGRVTLTQAWHDSTFPDGTYGGTPAGLIIEAEGKRVYHAGDTALFGDMALVGEGGLDVALLPVGDRYTMGPADAVRALDLLKPKVAVPIHWGTFPFLPGDPRQFADEGRARGVDVRVMEPGETLDV